jgi:hypothetical protein
MKQKDFLFIFISSFVVVAAWVGFNLYHKWVTSTISADLQIQINPIGSSFDRDTIEKLKQRTRISPAYELDGGTQPSPTQQPTVSLAPTTAIEPTTEPAAEVPPADTSNIQGGL